MKIIFVTRGLHDGGGIERVTSYISSLLASEGMTIEVICLQKKGRPFFPISSEVKVSNVCEFSGIGRVAKLRNHYKSERPDLIIFVGSNRSVSNLLAARGFNVATWEHFNTTIQSHPLHRFSRFLAAKYGWIIALTPEDAEAYRKVYHARNAVVIPNPITVDGLERSQLLEKRILAMGRLVGQKGFDRLLQAWAIVAPKHPDWVLRIVGSGRKYDQLTRMLRELAILDRVEMVPHTKDVNKEFSSSSVFVLSSRYEGFGLVLLEAMSAGLPSVSFDCPRGPRTLLGDHQCGVLVPNGDIYALANGIDELLSDPNKRKQMSEASYKKSREYSPGNILKLWIDNIRRITGK